VVVCFAKYNSTQRAQRFHRESQRSAISTHVILKDSFEARAEVARIIHRGGVIAFRTDTFYGLGADPFNREALRKIRQLKSREERKPILLLISDLSEVGRFITHQSEAFKTVADRFWPGPITLIGRARSELPMELTAGTQTIGLRLPNDDNVRSLLRSCGGALTATSANSSGGEPATTAAEVMDYFPTGIDIVLDWGAVTTTQPSTVLDLSGEVPLLVREGAISREELARLSADFATCESV
jgi:L-threonylcarbamoyladenylate synthase